MNHTPFGCLVAVVIFAFVPEPHEAHAQLRYGFSAGPNITSVEVDFENAEQPSYDAVVGFFAGVAAGLSLGPASIHAGATFINAGAIFDGSDFMERDNFNVNFVAIPVDVRVYFPISLIASPYLLGSGELRYRLDLSDADQEFEESLTRQSAAAGIGAGIRLNVPGLGLRISPEIRYAIDVTGISDGDVTVGDEFRRIRDEFKLDMLRFGLVVGL